MKYRCNHANMISTLCLIVFVIAGCSKSPVNAKKKADKSKQSKKTESAKFSNGIPKGIHVPPNSFVMVDKKNNDVFLFTLNPPKKQLVWHLEQKHGYVEPHFECDYVPLGNRLLCEEKYWTDGDDYVIFFISLDIEKQQVHYSSLINEYETSQETPYFTSRDILAVYEKHDDTDFHVFRMSDMASLNERSITRDNWGEYSNIKIVGISPKGTHILLSKETNNKITHQLLHIKSDKFINMVISSRKDIDLCGFVDERNILFLDARKGKMVDIEAESQPTAVFELPQIPSSKIYQPLRGISYRYHLIYKTNNTGFYSPMPDLVYIYDSQKRTFDQIDINFSDNTYYIMGQHSADDNSLLMRIQPNSSIFGKPPESHWYLWKSGELQNVTDKVKTLFGYMEI